MIFVGLLIFYVLQVFRNQLGIGGYQLLLADVLEKIVEGIILSGDE